MAKENKKLAGGIRKGCQPRLAANGYKLPEPLPPGEILIDMVKGKWKLGKSIGVGGFGEIYLASNEISDTVGKNSDYVIKVEPHTNGPLFVEMHFYHRVGKAELIDEWMKQKKLNFLGMPRFVSSGSHEHKGIKYRFMVMERYGEDLQKVLEKHNKVFPVKTVFSLGIKIIDILEYIHKFGYIHADVKASNLLLGFGKGKENQVYLVDFGLACKYTSDGKHKEYKEDLRKAHDGTIEFTSRDAHIGAHSRRGDIEILGYNMLQWLCGKLPWEDNLKNLDYVSKSKHNFIANIPKSIRKCFPSNSIPDGIEEYFQYVAKLNFDEEPDYNAIRNILKTAIKKAGGRNDGKLIFNKSPQVRSKSPKCKETVKKISVCMRKKESIKKQQSKSLAQHDSSLDNPTPAMLQLMQKRMQQQLVDIPNHTSKRRKRSSSDSIQASKEKGNTVGNTHKLRKRTASSQASPCSARKSCSPEF